MSNHHPLPGPPQGEEYNPYARNYPDGHAPLQSHPGNVVAVVALCLGIAAAVLGWVPYLSLALGVAGSVVSILALRRSKTLGRKGMSITAVILSGVATLSGAGSSLTWALAGPEIREFFEEASDGPAPSPASPDQGSESRIPGGPQLLVVGSDLKPGVYRSTSGDGDVCSWARLSQAPPDTSVAVAIGGSLANGYAFDGSAVVQVLAGDYGLQASGCGDWVEVDMDKPHFQKSFGSGQVIVGVDMEPGLWQATGTSGECRWTTYSSLTQEDEAYTSGGNSLTAAVVDIDLSDKLFATEDCGDWVKVDRPLTLQNPPADGVIPTGDNLVGRSIAPGIYTSTESSGELGCYWVTYRDTRMQDIGVSEMHVGPHVVQIQSTDAVFSSSPECGGWVAVDTTARLRPTIGDGDWLVGVDIAPGTYTSNHDAPADSYCSGKTSSDMTHEDDSLTGRGYDMSAFTVQEGDVLLSLAGHCGTYTKAP